MLSSVKKGLKRQRRERKLEGRKTYVRNLKRFIAKKRAGVVKDKVKKEPKKIPPYRLILLQARLDRLEAAIRNMERNSVERQKAVNRLTDIKKKLGK